MRSYRAVIVVATLALIAAACTGDPVGPTDDTADPGADVGARTLTYSVTSEVMLGWDPASGYSNEVVAMHNMYETLTRYDAAAENVQPLLAESWEASGDGLEWSFTLRDGVTFHTGRQLDAEAAMQAIERTRELGEAAAYIWDAVEEIEATDDRTLTFRLSYPSPLDLVASGTYSAYIYDTEAAGDEDLAEWFGEGNDAGTGPYTVDEYNPGDEVELRLSAYEDYWGGWNDAYYDNYVFRVTPEASTAAQLLRSGDATIVQRMSPQLWASFEEQDGFQTTAEPSWQTLLALLNTQKGPLQDDRVREAISLALDYDGMMAALEGAAEPLSGYVPPGLWGHAEGLERNQNLDEARRLLDEAGYGPDGNAMTLELTYLRGDADEELVATVMRSNLADLNIDLQLRGLQWQAQWDKALSEDEAERQDILVFYWWPDYPDPVSWFYSLFRTEEEPFFNLAYYSNPRLDGMIDEAAVVAATDRDAAIDMYRDMQQMVLDDMPAIPLYTQVYQRAMLEGVDGFVDNPAYPNVVFGHGLTPRA
jgi:peptide/nickel transport system substrate-binding protein